MRTVMKVVLIVLVLFLAWYALSQAGAPDEVHLTINVPSETAPENVSVVLDLLDSVNASATVFATGEWVANNTALADRIIDRHELSCHTMSGSRLTILEGEGLEAEIVCSVEGVEFSGFRAPANDVGNASYNIIKEHYAYDSSVYHRYRWFWEEPPQDLREVPITSVLALPLDDSIGLRTVPLGEFFFLLARHSHSDPIIISLDASEASERLLEVEYTVRSFQEDGARVIPIREGSSWPLE